MPSNSSCPRNLAFRLRLALALFGALCATVFARVVVLEVTQGDAFRTAAGKPLMLRRSLPGMRGRILARDGSVLACDEQLVTLAVHYRQLEQPANPRWLRSQARSHLPPNLRREPERVAEAEAAFLQQRAELHRRLADCCGLSLAQWQSRTAAIQARVEKISMRVNAGQPSPAIVVAEELQHHTVAYGLPVSVIAEIESYPERFPGVQVQQTTRRNYALGDLASHVLGHLGAADDNSLDPVGRLGLERQFESLLRGERGEVLELRRRNGDVISRTRQREPAAGRDLLLTLDLALQRTAESLLDDACRRAATFSKRTATQRGLQGGAIVVLDVHSGAILAAASAPRFDPNLFSNTSAWPSAEHAEAIRQVLDDPRHPLFDRVCRMALPPGSVFKTVTATALLEAGIPAERTVHCRGYFAEPDHLRCRIFTRHGLGHGETTLTAALVQSCNVYFFQTAAEMGPGNLRQWATRLGFGRTTGIDLPGEAAGKLPTPADIPGWTEDDTRLLAIGQGALTATPLQVARMIAAVANGGLLVTPHVVRGLGLPADPVTDDDGEHDADRDDEVASPAPQPIEGLSSSTLSTLRTALERVVADPQGTAHGAVHLDAVSIAGKTGTAETGTTKDGMAQDDHAWFAGYAPADSPRLAFVVVLEHAGDGATAAGPVARRLVQHLQQAGYFGSQK